MIARRCGDDSALLLVVRQLCQRIACAAFLKTSRALQVVELAENLHASDLAERDGRRARRIVNCAHDAITRCFDVLERDHALESWRKTANRQLRAISRN